MAPMLDKFSDNLKSAGLRRQFNTSIEVQTRMKDNSKSFHPVLVDVFLRFCLCHCKILFLPSCDLILNVDLSVLLVTRSLRQILPCFAKHDHCVFSESFGMIIAISKEQGQSWLLKDQISNIGHSLMVIAIIANKRTIIL